MDIQFYGANCISIATKQARIIIDDNLKELGAKSVTKPDDIVLFTSPQKEPPKREVRLEVDCPGEYEVGDISIYGIAAKSHMPDLKAPVTIYKIIANDLTVVILGHIAPELTDEQIEEIGHVDILFIPVGGHGYTLDATNAIKIAREIAPKLLIPTHYIDSGINYPVPQDSIDEALKVLAMQPKERVAKLKIKPADLTDTMQLVILENS